MDSDEKVATFTVGLILLIFVVAALDKLFS